MNTPNSKTSAPPKRPYVKPAFTVERVFVTAPDLWCGAGPKRQATSKELPNAKHLQPGHDDPCPPTSKP